MLSQEIQFAVIVKNGKVVQVGRSEVFQLQTAQNKEKVTRNYITTNNKQDRKEV